MSTAVCKCRQKRPGAGSGPWHGGKRHRLPEGYVNDDVYLVNRIRYECGVCIRRDGAMGQNVEIEDKKLEIVRYAFDRFYEGGFHATGMEAALAGSGISKRTLYKYF